MTHSPYAHLFSKHLMSMIYFVTSGRHTRIHFIFSPTIAKCRRCEKKDVIFHIFSAQVWFPPKVCLFHLYLTQQQLTYVRLSYKKKIEINFFKKYGLCFGMFLRITNTTVVARIRYRAGMRIKQKQRVHYQASHTSNILQH